MTANHQPEFDAFCALAREGNLIPVYREILADLDTPVSAFLKLDDVGDAFLLESVEGGEKWARYSFLGTAPSRVLIARGDTVQDGPPGGPFATRTTADALGEARTLLATYRPVPLPGLPRFTGGLVGFLGYDLVRSFEQLPATARDDLGHPDYYLMLIDALVVFDTVAQSMKVVAHAHVEPGGDLRAAYDAACARVDALVERLRRPVAPPPPVRVEGPPVVRSNLEPKAYEAIVDRAKEYIRAGDVIQVVLAQRFQCALRAHPFDIYRCLRTFNPSPYMFFLRTRS